MLAVMTSVMASFTTLHIIDGQGPSPAVALYPSVLSLHQASAQPARGNHSSEVGTEACKAYSLGKLVLAAEGFCSRRKVVR